MLQWIPAALRVRLRRPTPYLALSAAVVLTTGAVSYHWLHAAEQGAQQYGSPIDVVVATTDLRPGDTLTDDNTEIARRPSKSVALTTLRTRSVGRRLFRAVSAGEAIVRADLAPPAMSALAARLPAGTVGVAVPRGETNVAVERGDYVDLLVPGQNTAVDNVVVIARSDETLTVAVRQDQAAALAEQLAAGTVVPVVRGVSATTDE